MKSTIKKILFALMFFLIGITVSQIPDLAGLYCDYVIHKYQKKYCADKGVGPNKCYFDMYFEPYKRENPTLVKIEDYFIMGEGSLYYIASGRCSNQTFYNPSAAPKGSGKITNRQYFWTECSRFRKDVSDLIFRDKDKENSDEFEESY